ncbi:flagellar M-ring protein FliF [Pantoea sp. JGM49]|uniref:flagellar basal-body MS-ring/collar protein FliF n=1 Tax=unclassified Pantoea TaxID=2630326 RepID=UPI000BC98C0C|nr:MULTISPECIES: flagellar basal-body MS-ring/collar protein FliF [unclassified Pantoea]MBS0882953.1 flagellar M-ring protein FliF [Pantoea sp. JGM49]MXP54483.1 flagellar basal body M-ring protein FliF [Pantoea sp. Seng]SNY67467.1 flagellar M-ring protein FliF [Pantoea sp. GL120224-02]
MSATLKDLNHHPSAQLKSVLLSLRSSPKIALAIAAAATLSVVIALVMWANQQSYSILLSNISDEDGGAIVAQLTQLNVPYRIDASSGAIRVPEGQVHEVRMKLAQQGLPKGGAVGFELLDQEKFGISQFSEQVNFQRALEGELSRTIENLGPIQSARVHLAVPKPSLFVREQKAPTASVSVNLINGRTLDEGQIVAITHLISSAVTGLAAENVTLVDQRGNLLTQSGMRGLQTSQLKYTNDIEFDYQQRIQRMLAPLVGENNVRAQVTAQIDFTQLEQTQEQYQPNSDPQKMAIRSRQASQAEQGNNSGTGGVPGALSHQPPTPATAPITQPLGVSDSKRPAGQPFNNRNDETTNFELDRTLIHSKSSIGRIERLSVAVVINHLPQGEEGSVSAMSDEQLARLNTLVQEAIGYQATRGDSINIMHAPFNGLVDEPPLPLWQQASFHTLLMNLFRYLVVAIIAWIMWRKLVQPSWERHQQTTLRQMELEKEARDEAAAAQKHAAENDVRQRAQQRAHTEISTQQLRELAEQEPRVIALVLRQWMNQEGRP